MADTRDLKSLVKYLTYGFESRLRHFLIRLKPCASKLSALITSANSRTLRAYFDDI